MNTAARTLLVTGASGYLASWVVAQLLEAGHTVHGTVRDLTDVTKVGHLRDLAASCPQRLRLFEADLMTPGSFDAAMAGCTAVIHTASPYFLSKPKDVDRELLQPALKGTLNVLDSVERAPSVTRVILTSSIAALYDNACDVDRARSHTVTEADVNPNRNPRQNPYAYSKTVADQAAWDRAAKQRRWSLVTVHPGAIFGPALSRRTDSTSIEMMIQFLNGSFKSGVPRLYLGVVDVRDVAAVHIRAALLSQSFGRYIAVAQTLRLLEMAALMQLPSQITRKQLPQSEVSKFLIWLIAPFVGMQRKYVACNVGYPLYFDNRRSQSEMDVKYRNPDATLNDHIQQLFADGLVQA